MADEAPRPQLPDVPTTIESGFPKLQATYWTAVLAPAGTPPAIVGRLNAAINEITNRRRWRKPWRSSAPSAKVGSPEDVAAFMAGGDQEMDRGHHRRKHQGRVKRLGIR